MAVHQAQSQQAKRLAEIQKALEKASEAQGIADKAQRRWMQASQMEMKASKRNLTGGAAGGSGGVDHISQMEEDGDITTLADGDHDDSDGDADGEMGNVAMGQAAQGGAAAGGGGGGGDTKPGARPPLLRRPSEIARARFGYSAEQAGRLANEAQQAAIAQMQLAERLLMEEGLSVNEKDLEGDFKKFSQRIMSGLHSFDLHDSIHYSRLFGFASHVPKGLKRRIDLSTTRKMDMEEDGQSMGMHFNQRVAHGQGFDVPMVTVPQPGQARLGYGGSVRQQGAQVALQAAGN